MNERTNSLAVIRIRQQEESSRVLFNTSAGDSWRFVNSPSEA